MYEATGDYLSCVCTTHLMVNYTLDDVQNITIAAKKLGSQT